MTTATDTRVFGVRFGALAEPIRAQVESHGWKLTDTDAKKFQKAADDVSTLRIQGFITWKQGDKAYERIFKAIEKAIFR